MIYRKKAMWLQLVLGLIAMLVAALWHNTGHAAYPDKPVHLIIPFAPGGPSDVLGRLIGQKLSESLDQPVVVENKPGAGTNIAAQFVARSPADGYTLFLMMVGTQAINEAMYSNLGYSTVRDFEPITLVASSSLTLVAHPFLPAKNLMDVVTYAKSHPGQLNYASSGAGTPLHMAGELLNNRADIKLTHIPYKGAAPALNDVLGGQVQLAMVGTPSVLQHIKAGKLNAIGVTGKERDTTAPDIPTIGESLPGYDVELVYSIVAPAGTPSDIVGRLNTEIKNLLEQEDTRAQLLKLGFETRTSTPAETAAYIKNEIAKWAPIVKQSGAIAN